MILYSLRCARGHDFESWFANAAAYDSLAAKMAVVCPVCDSAEVEKALMAPRLAKGADAPARAAQTGAQSEDKSDDANATTPAAADAGKISLAAGAGTEAEAALSKLRDFVESNCEDVGARFADEARKIHYDEAEKRGIYGEATPEEARDLIEEGVPVGRLPWRSRHDS